MKPFSSTLVLLTISILISQNLVGQSNRPKTNSKSYIGVEALIGTQTSIVHSDISAIDNTNVFMFGKGIGVIAGNTVLHTKVRRSYFKTEPLADQKFKFIETEGLINLFPLQMLRKKPRYFEPYITIGVSRGTLNFYGDYGAAINAIKNKKVKANQNSNGSLPCSCTCGGTSSLENILTPSDPLFHSSPTAIQPGQTMLPPGDPDQESSSVYLGKATMFKATFGTGLQAHIPGARKFLNLFAEVKYGFPLSYRAGSSFENTKTSPQLSINFGTVIGISY